MSTPNLYPFSGFFIDSPAVYLIYDRQMNLIYIGQTNDLGRRMNEHRGDTSHLMHRHVPTYVAIEFIMDEASRCARERQLITQYAPPCNRC
jgi:predicted GIY-YIG superfamily endonuclease